jgi:hypothetical protein
MSPANRIAIIPGDSIGRGFAPECPRALEAAAWRFGISPSTRPRAMAARFHAGPRMRDLVGRAGAPEAGTTIAHSPSDAAPA